MFTKYFVLYIFLNLFESSYCYMQISKLIQGVQNKHKEEFFNLNNGFQKRNKNSKQLNYFDFQSFSGLKSKSKNKNDDNQYEFQDMKEQMTSDLLRQQELRNKQTLRKEKEVLQQYQQQVQRSTDSYNNPQDQVVTTVKHNAPTAQAVKQNEAYGKGKPNIDFGKWQNDLVNPVGNDAFQNEMRHISKLPHYVYPKSNRNIMKKSPKRIIQKIIKGQQRRKYMNHPSHRYFTTAATTTIKTQVAQTLPTIRKNVRSLHYTKVARYPMPFHNLAPKHSMKKFKNKNTVLDPGTFMMNSMDHFANRGTRK